MSWVFVMNTLIYTLIYTQVSSHADFPRWAVEQAGVTLLGTEQSSCEIWLLHPLERSSGGFCFFVPFPVFEPRFLSFLEGGWKHRERAVPSGRAVVVPCLCSQLLRVRNESTRTCWVLGQLGGTLTTLLISEKSAL